MGISHIKVSHAHHSHSKRDDQTVAACKSGSTQFITSPTTGSSIDALQPLEITWNPDCVTAPALSLYVIASSLPTPGLYNTTSIPTSAGKYSLQLKPRWWNSTSSQTLQVALVPSTNALWDNDYPGGPVFIATYTPPSDGTIPAIADVSKKGDDVPVASGAIAQSGMNPGKTAAAVLLPLLFVLLCIGAYLKMQRSKGKDKRKRWSEAVDKRMSTISTDWKSVSAAGAQAAIRNSIAVGNNRNSSFSFGAIRPGSTYAAENGEVAAGQAGVGARQMSQMRPGVGLRNPASLPSASSTERVSRVSFAADTRVSRVSFADSARPSIGSRPSGEQRRTRAFHSAYIPPVPTIPANAADTSATIDEDDDRSIYPSTHGHTQEEDERAMSPRQTQGPLTLTPEDIRARIAGGRARAESNAAKGKQQQSEGDEMDEVMPALSMMRTGTTSPNSNGASDADDFLFTPPAPPTPTYNPSANGYSPAFASSNAPYTGFPNSPFSPNTPGYPASPYSPNPTSPVSPVMSTMPMQPMPASVMSPDEMLRAYAERKKAAAAGGVTGGKPEISYPMPIATNGARPLFGATGTVSPNNTGNGASGHQTTGSVGVGSYGGAMYAIGDDEDAYGGTTR